MESLKNKDPFLHGKKCAIALSGGIDSIVLLHYLHQNHPDNLRAVHINHHLSKHCDEWQKFCQNLCENLHIEYENINIFIKDETNIEENARQKRYRALSSNLTKDEILCTAHHQNDQAETLLLQLFRGAGMSGLAAMPKLKSLGKGIHYRPLLTVEKSSIIDYAKQHKLHWIEDDSNQNTHFRRNFLRLEILPKLNKVYNNLTQTLSRSAQHQAESLALLRELATLDINNHGLINSHNRLNIPKLTQLETRRVKNILRFHLSSLEFLMPSDKVLTQIVNILNAKNDANPLVNWATYEARSYQNELYLIDKSVRKTQTHCPFYQALKDLPNFSVRYRIEGQRVKLAGKAHSQSLKKVLQTAGIPPWERNLLRMYYINDELRAIERIGKMQGSEKE